jgi:hypothetical protein
MFGEISCLLRRRRRSHHVIISDSCLRSQLRRRQRLLPTPRRAPRLRPHGQPPLPLALPLHPPPSLRVCALFFVLSSFSRAHLPLPAAKPAPAQKPAAASTPAASTPAATADKVTLQSATSTSPLLPQLAYFFPQGHVSALNVPIARHCSGSRRSEDAGGRKHRCGQATDEDAHAPAAGCAFLSARR